MTPDPAADPTRSAPKFQHTLLFWAVIAGILTAAAGVWWVADSALEILSWQTLGLHYQDLKQQVAEHTTQAALVYVAAYTLLGALILPGGALLAVVAGLLFGAGLGIPLSVIASTLAAVTAFMLARSVLGKRAAAIESPLFERLRTGFGRHALGYLMFLRLTPGLPFAAVNVIPSLLGVPLATFVLGSVLGLLPSRIALSTAGAGLGSVIEKQNAVYSQCVAHKASHGADCVYQLNAGSLLTTEMVAAFLALALLALVPAMIDVAPRMWRRIKSPPRR